jgi:PAS domain S-box-containing protein
LHATTPVRALLTGNLPAIADLGRTLLQLNYDVETQSNREAALEAWTRGRCDMVLLSVSRRQADPFSLVTAFRERRPHSPIVVVSDMAQAEDRVTALNAGADDYITEPFAVPELRARLSAIARNRALRFPPEIRVGPLLLQSGSPTVLVGANRADVTPRERALLEMFAVAPENVVGKSAIARRFSDGPEPVSNTAVEILVHRLRRRLLPLGISIVTLRGVGYRLQFADDDSAWSDSPERQEPKLPDVPLSQTLPDADPQHWNTQLLEFTHDAIIIWEMHGRGILYWNAAAELLYGYSRAAAHGQTTHDLLKTQLAGGVTTLENNLARYGVWIGELTHTTRTGDRVLVEGRLALMSQRNDSWLVLEVNRDITDQKAADSSRRAMEQQLEDLRLLRGD